MNLYYLQIDAKKFLGGGGIAILAIVISLSLSFWWWEQEKRAMEKPLTPPTRAADQRVEGFVWQELKDDKKQYEIIADLAEVFVKEQTAVLKQVEKPVEARTYYEQGPVSLFARQITYNLNTKDAEARGDVLVVTEEGSTLRTESIQWKASLGQIQTQDPVVMEREGLHLTGTGMIGDTRLEKVTLFGRIQTTFKGSGGGIFMKRKQP